MITIRFIFGLPGLSWVVTFVMKATTQLFNPCSVQNNIRLVFEEKLDCAGTEVTDPTFVNTIGLRHIPDIVFGNVE